MRQEHSAGRMRFAQSSSLKTSDVAPNANNAAFLAWMKGSRRERVNAAIRTLDRVLRPRFFASFPRQIVVFVRIPGCSSLEVLAKYLNNSPLIVRSDNLDTIVSTAFTVCSRTTGATSVKPVTWYELSVRVNTSLVRPTYHLWEDFIVDYSLRQSIDHEREVIE